MTILQIYQKFLRVARKLILKNKLDGSDELILSENQITNCQNEIDYED